MADWEKSPIGLRRTRQTFLFRLIGRERKHPDPGAAILRVNWNLILGMIDPLYVASGFGVGILVGMTGVGGGSLMTPLLILLFGIHPTTAVGTDLLYAAGRSEEAMAHLKQAVIIFAEIGTDAGELQPEIWKLVEW